VRGILASGFGEEIASYIPAGTKFLNAGREALVGLMPSGDVIKVSIYDPNTVDHPDLLKPFDDLIIGNYRLEILPKALVGREVDYNELGINSDILRKRLMSRDDGEIKDWGKDQIGKVGDKWYVLDRGTFRSKSD
jgi:hypothetical protein